MLFYQRYWGSYINLSRKLKELMSQFQITEGELPYLYTGVHLLYLNDVSYYHYFYLQVFFSARSLNIIIECMEFTMVWCGADTWRQNAKLQVLQSPTCRNSISWLQIGLIMGQAPIESLFSHITATSIIFWEAFYFYSDFIGLLPGIFNAFFINNLLDNQGNCFSLYNTYVKYKLE